MPDLPPEVKAIVREAMKAQIAQCKEDVVKALRNAKSIDTFDIMKTVGEVGPAALHDLAERLNITLTESEAGDE